MNRMLLLYSILLLSMQYTIKADAPEKNTEKKENLEKSQHVSVVSKRVSIDKFLARVNGSNITLSDLMIPRISKEGGRFTLDEAIDEEILYQRAAEMKMMPSTLDVERQLVAFKMQNNLTAMTDEEFEAQLKQSGFTLKMYKNQLGRLLAVENVKRAEVSEKIIVTTQEVEEEYKKHKRYTEERYLIKVCQIPEDQIDKKDEFAKSEKVVWEDLDWINKKNIRPEFSPVFEMNKGDISQPLLVDNQYQLIMLADKQDRRQKTLDELYGKIERSLQEKKKEKFVSQFGKDLKEKASIVYL